ncbi:hypothetical protein LTS17_003051 [Exophiala oligosperma]
MPSRSSNPPFLPRSSRPLRKFSFSTCSSFSSQKDLWDSSIPGETVTYAGIQKNESRHRHSSQAVFDFQKHQAVDSVAHFHTAERAELAASQRHQRLINNEEASRISQAQTQTDEVATLAAPQGVDAWSIPLDQSRRQTAIFIGPVVEAPSKAPGRESGPAAGTYLRVSSAYVDMHRPLHKEDYLIARGANPRTGVVTPGSHSASSSVDGKSPVPHGRWRQRGDEWISSDFEQETPPPKQRKERLSSPHQRLRLPPKLVARERGSSVGELSAPIKPLGQNSRSSNGDTFAFYRHVRESEMHREVPIRTISPQMRQKQSPGEPGVRRKPVGTPPKGKRDGAKSDSPAIDESDDTVLRHPKLETDLRSSSAPVPAPLRNFGPCNVDKDLPTLPGDTPRSPSQEYRTIATQNPFLGGEEKETAREFPDPTSQGSTGRAIAQKDLPCLPMNNGPSRLRQASTPMELGTPEECHEPTSRKSSRPERGKPSVSIHTTCATDSSTAANKKGQRPLGCKADASTHIRQSAKATFANYDETNVGENRRSEVDATNSDADAEQEQGRPRPLIEYHFHSHKHYYQPAWSSQAANGGTKTFDARSSDDEYWPPSSAEKASSTRHTRHFHEHRYEYE